MYADDVVSFLRPIASDIDLSLDLFDLFGEASRLKTNVQKSNGFPIQCTEMDLTFYMNTFLVHCWNFLANISEYHSP